MIRIRSRAFSTSLRNNFYLSRYNGSHVDYQRRISSSFARLTTSSRRASVTPLVRVRVCLLVHSLAHSLLPFSLLLFADARGSSIIRSDDRQRHLLSWLLCTAIFQAYTLITSRNSKVLSGIAFSACEWTCCLRRWSSKGSCVVSWHNNVIERRQRHSYSLSPSLSLSLFLPHSVRRSLDV